MCGCLCGPHAKIKIQNKIKKTHKKDTARRHHAPAATDAGSTQIRAGESHRRRIRARAGRRHPSLPSRRARRLLPADPATAAPSSHATPRVCCRRHRRRPLPPQPAAAAPPKPAAQLPIGPGLSRARSSRSRLLLPAAAAPRARRCPRLSK